MIGPLAVGAVVVGALVGPLVARASLSTPEGGAEPAPRIWTPALVAACPALAIWSVMAKPGAEGAVGALLAWLLLLLALLDARKFWLPLPLTLAVGASGLVAGWAAGDLPARLTGAVAGFAMLTALALAYRRLRGREGLGGGDAYLLAGGGAWVGWTGLPTVLVWAAGAGLLAVAAAALSGRRIGADQPIPFGVGLALGIWLTWLYGPIGRG